MRYIYLLLILIAGIAFVVGLIERIYGAPENWFPPLTLWRFTIGCLAFAIVFVLLDLRDHLVAKKKEE